jgi:hypothetical protein
MKYLRKFKVFESYSEFVFNIINHEEEFAKITDDEFNTLKSLSNIDLIKSNSFIEKNDPPLYSRIDIDTITGKYYGKVEFSIFKLSSNEFILDIQNAKKSYKCDDFESLLDLLKEKEYIKNEDN